MARQHLLPRTGYREAGASLAAGLLALDATNHLKMQPSELELAHKHSIRHRSEIERSDVCGCFYCLATYAPSAVTDWVDWPENTPDGMEDAYGQTALCPRCGIDSVLGSASGFAITRQFLETMRTRWFETVIKLPVDDKDRDRAV